MKIEQFKTLAIDRILIGYLGEREQLGWWQSSFFTQGNDAFLSPLFSRTITLAQCNGITRAASLVHDERIGVGSVYHLFRLPEDFEQGIHYAFYTEDLGKIIQKITANKNSALDYLNDQSIMPDALAEGPIRVGNVDNLRDGKSWQKVLGYYSMAVKQGSPIFPYFVDIR